jgi:uncharacterized protein YbjT (DUF2867 family)
LKALGAEIMFGDLRDAASLRIACDGVDAVISTASATTAPRNDDNVINVDGEGQRALMDAARAAGVARFVFVSFSGNIRADTPLHEAKRDSERHLQHSGMTWTVLRPTAFMEVWLTPAVGFDVPNGALTIYGDGTAPISYISLHDVAAFCVDALRNPAAENAIIELGGPAAVTPLEAAHLAEQVTGRPMSVQHVPAAALQAQYEAATDPLQKSFAGLTLSLAAGDAIPMTATLARFPIRLRSVRDFLVQAYGSAQKVETPSSER